MPKIIEIEGKKLYLLRYEFIQNNMPTMRNVVIGFLGTQLDMGKRRNWRPSVSLCLHLDFQVDRLELLYDRKFLRLAKSVQRDIIAVQPETEVLLRQVNLEDPWDFQEVYGALFDFAQDYGFDEDREQYHVHLTTGTHVAQICWFLLTESRHVPARLLQTSPPKRDEGPQGSFNIIDLDLSRYDALQQRFDLAAAESNTLLKGGIETKNPTFNALIEKIGQVAVSSNAPILLMGDTGTGKSDLASRIYELKLQRRMVKGRLVQVNCSTLIGEQGMATLFGHRRAALGSHGQDRRGLLREADGGVLFLDEIDQLGLYEQAIVLHAVETGTFYPLGSDHEVTVRLQLIAGANRNLAELTAKGAFRADLFARLNLWTMNLPALRDRREDIQANIEYELNRAERALGERVGFNKDAADAYVRFAKDPASLWRGNFRDLSASIQRLCTLAPRGRITMAMVEQEIRVLNSQWRNVAQNPDRRLLIDYLEGSIDKIDPFDIPQLANVIRVCTQSPSLSAAGRTLYSASRAEKKSKNDADRLRKYLERFGLTWGELASS